jgi:flagellin-like hook-associated protein FlgL
MADINLSKAVRSNLSSLQTTASMMSKTSDRLSTGNKVNSALDNPTNFFTASSLNSRAGDLNNLMDSMANGIKTIEAADNGLSAITKNLESMQSTLRQARQDKSFQTQSFDMSGFDANAATAPALNLSGGSVGNGTSIAMTTTGTGKTASTSSAYAAPTAAAKSTLTGSVDFSTGITGAPAFEINFGGQKATVTVPDAANTPADAATAVTAALVGTDLEGKVEAVASGNFIRLQTVGNSDDAITVTASAGATAALGTLTSVTGSDGKTAFTVNGKAVELTTAETSVDAAVSKANAQLGADSKFEAFKDTNNLGFRAKTADAGALVIAGKQGALFGAATDNASLKFAKSVDQMVSSVNTALEGKVRASNDNGKLRLENLSTQDLNVGGFNPSSSKLDGGTGTGKIGGNTVRADLASQFNELRDQLDKLSDDASFNGINLLRGDKLKITFNETGTSSIDIQTKGEKSINASNLQLSTTLTAKDLDGDTSIDAFLDQTKTALNSVRAQSSAFGSNLSIVQNRQDFTKSMINTLETGAGNLTLADMNSEAANMMALQTRQSLAQSTLSMANQADQGVLQLLR